MRNIKKILCVMLSALIVVSCAGISAFAADSASGESGTLNVISYDLQGTRVSSDPLFGMGDISEIGSILNAMKYDIVAVQEDIDISVEDFPTEPEFTDFHDLFVAEMTNYANVYEESSDNIVDNVIDTVLGNEAAVIERHQTVPTSDGLGIYSTYALYDTNRQLWTVSDNRFADGSAQSYSTGFVVVTVELADGYYLDIYNVSADEYADSVKARQAQFAQLAEFIKKYSVYDAELGVYEHAVLVLGNLNAGICQEDTVYSDNGLILNLLEGAGLNDAWAVTTINDIDEDPDTYEAYYNYALRTELTDEQSYGHYDSVERILYADGNGIDLTCSSFNYADIQGSAGTSLSDHKAAIAQIGFEIVDKTYDYGNEGADKVVDEEMSWLLRFLYAIADAFKAIGYFFQNLFK